MSLLNYIQIDKFLWFIIIFGWLKLIVLHVVNHGLARQVVTNDTHFLHCPLLVFHLLLFLFGPLSLFFILVNFLIAGSSFFTLFSFLAFLRLLFGHLFLVFFSFSPILLPHGDLGLDSDLLQIMLLVRG